VKLGVMLAARSVEEAETRLRQARDAGFSLCQMNLQKGGCTRADLVSIADRMLEYGVRPVAVGCYVNPMKPEDPGPLGVSRSDVLQLLHQLDIVGARRIVFFSGTFSDAPFEAHPDNFTDDALDRLAAFVSGIVAETKARRYELVIEPWYGHVLSSETRIIAFHERLEPAVSEHVRYVIDACALIGPDRYAQRDEAARHIVRAIGRAAGVVHLRDCVMPPDGEPDLTGPGQGKLDYPAYLAALEEFVPGDTPAVVRNIGPDEFAQVRDYLLRLTTGWQLA
jgi:sugar phosphate isomerase/epimerase